MKKLVYVLFGISTFSVGFWSFQFIFIFLLPVSLCTNLQENLEIYHSKQIHIEAYL